MHGFHDHGSFFPNGKHFRIWMSCLIVVIVLVLLGVLVVYLALHPQKPRFNVQDATVRELNQTKEVLTSSFQFSIESHNPNNKISIYYGSLSVYASYGGQQITPPCSFTPFYQGTNEKNVLVPILYANSVANQPNYVTQSGLLALTLTTNRRIRWKVGLWTSGHYYLNVNCFVVMGTSNNSNGGQVPLQPGTNCQVNIGG